LHGLLWMPAVRVSLSWRPLGGEMPPVASVNAPSLDRRFPAQRAAIKSLHAGKSSLYR
jgi:hypothetical protein